MVSLFCLTLTSVGHTQIIDPILPVPPGIRITSPPNHVIFYAPVDIPIFAYVDRSVLAATNASVAFYAGTNKLGLGFRLDATVRPVGVYLPLVPIADNAFSDSLASLYCFVWTNPPPGAYALTAVKTGVADLSRTSAPVSITVVASTTNTNHLDVVDIVATDPIAIASTNFWVWPGLTNATPSWTNWPGPVVPYTNWAPKSGLFTVRRVGNAISNLTVNYNIGGTASNGVDYAALQGYVTIPAGEAYALIPIVPIDNGPPYAPKTVVLKLAPSANYAIGFPPAAAVLILGEWPRPWPVLLADGSFHLAANGPDGAWFSAESSADLLNWTSLCTNQVVAGSIDFLDPNASSSNTFHFYRAVPQPNAPSE
jgi:hypothetical protein